MLYSESIVDVFDLFWGRAQSNQVIDGWREPRGTAEAASPIPRKLEYSMTHHIPQLCAIIYYNLLEYAIIHYKVLQHDIIVSYRVL